MSALTEIEEMLAELRALRTFKAEQAAFTSSLERKLESAEKAVRTLREKVAKLEARPGLLDGEDEDWLWDVGATIQFRRRFTGGRTITIEGRGKRLTRLSTADGQPLLGKALEDASGRSRGRASDEAPTRSGQGHRQARA